ncbi:MAG: FHA domain-containing protein [Bdellovibrionota bacterium]
MYALSNGGDAPVPITGGLIIGTDATCGFAVSSLAVCPHHCRLMPHPAGATVENLSQGQGTYVRGGKVGKGLVLLRPGEELRLGDEGGPTFTLVKTAAPLVPDGSPAAFDDMPVIDADDSADPAGGGSGDPSTPTSPPPPKRRGLARIWDATLGRLWNATFGRLRSSKPKRRGGPVAKNAKATKGPKREKPAASKR